jgi:hypothetical protein
MPRKASAWKYPTTVILAVAAMAVVVYYSVCGNSCSYLKGTILGIDLTYVGLAYMTAVVVVSAFKADWLLLPLLAGGIGVELFLVGIQVKHDTYCPYCLTFGSILVVQFILNLDLKKKGMTVACIAAGLILFFVLFKGQFTPKYTMDRHVVPVGSSSGSSTPHYG